MVNIGVLASGRGTNLQAIIEAIKEGKIEGRISILISDNQEAFALKRAKQNNIETKYINFKSFKNRENYDKKIVECLKEKDVDLVVLSLFYQCL
jgi:phosphoribosylglycinamide formyltransferase-1